MTSLQGIGPSSPTKTPSTHRGRKACVSYNSQPYYRSSVVQVTRMSERRKETEASTPEKKHFHRSPRVRSECCAVCPGFRFAESRFRLPYGPQPILYANLRHHSDTVIMYYLSRVRFMKFHHPQSANSSEETEPYRTKNWRFPMCGATSHVCCACISIEHRTRRRRYRSTRYLAQRLT